MQRYVLKRVLLLIPVIIAVSFIVFALLELMPGTFVDTLISGDMTPEEIAALRADYNLDKPMLYRYGLYMLNLVQGDLGLSMSTGLNVFDMYISKLPNTLLLAFCAAIIGVAISIPMGIRAARKAGTLTDTVTTTFTLVGMSMPPFWLALLLLLLFSLNLGWLPAGGNQDGIKSLILPAICCAMSLTAQCTRQTRSSMLDVLNADYLRTARAKGAPEEVVIKNHAFRNALIPIITTVGGSICVQLAGSAVIEQVFAWPGVGRMLVDGVFKRDVPVIIGCVIMTTILYVVVMLIVDLLYAFVDPRIKSRYVGKRQKSKTAASATHRREEAHAAAAAEHHEKAGATEQLDGALPEITKILLSQGDSNASSADYADSSDTSYSGAQDYVTRRNEDIIANYSSTEDEAIAKYKKRSQLGQVMHRLVRNKSALAGLIILGFVLLVALVSLFLSFESVTASNVMDSYSPPSWKYPFGTDNMGRNAFLRVIYGSRYSIIIGFGSVLLSALIGITLGSVAGYFGGITENIIMRFSDILASIPGLLLGIVIMVVLGQKMQNLIIAVGVAASSHFIRMARASILTVKENEYVEAARAIGFSDFRIILTQVLPNGLSPIMIQATMSLGFAIIIAASLSFLGFGIPAPTPEWGSLISAGREAARSAPWLMAFPGMAIMITVLGFNLLGDGLRDALDPKLKK